jgi:hypothetical protein
MVPELIVASSPSGTNFLIEHSQRRAYSTRALHSTGRHIWQQDDLLYAYAERDRLNTTTRNCTNTSIYAQWRMQL